MRLRAPSLLHGLSWLCLIKCCLSGQACDNGKTKLEMDLPRSDELVCPQPWPAFPKRLADISTKSPLQPAEQICMNMPITYNPAIPNSGSHRPVGAMSGEYLYCPPQRWLKNLKDGATVLLYHPCASEDARQGLAMVARSCLADYILTAHPQLSQHRPYALVSWGHTLEMSQVTPSGVCEWLLAASSNLNQTKKVQGPKYSLYLTKAAPVDRVLGTTVTSLRACCVEALSAKESSVGRTRMSRAARSVQVEGKDEVKQSGPAYYSSDSKQLGSAQTLNVIEDKRTPSADPHSSHVTSIHNPTEMEGRTAAAGQKMTKGPSGGHDEVRTKVGKKSETDIKLHKKTELEAQKHRVKTDTEEKAAGGGCEGQGQCRATKAPKVDGPLRGGIPTTRTNEAVWAAAALGFLLVLLTLSVLHTRLYRNWRPPPSLYWHETQQDYESVADIIRRRLRMVGRRKRRASQSRRQECPLLPDSSTDNESE